MRGQASCLFQLLEDPGRILQSLPSPCVSVSSFKATCHQTRGPRFSSMTSSQLIKLAKKATFWATCSCCSRASWKAGRAVVHDVTKSQR